MCTPRTYVQECFIATNRRGAAHPSEENASVLSVVEEGFFCRCGRLVMRLFYRMFYTP